MTKRIEKIIEDINKFIAYLPTPPKRIYLNKNDYELLRDSMPKNMQMAYPKYYPHKGVKVKPLGSHMFPDEEE